MKRNIPSGAVTMDGIAQIWGVCKRTAERKMEALKIQPIQSVRQKPIIWLEAKIRAYAPVIPQERKERARTTDKRTLPAGNKLAKISRRAQAAKGGAK